MKLKSAARGQTHRILRRTDLYPAMCGGRLIWFEQRPRRPLDLDLSSRNPNEILKWKRSPYPLSEGINPSSCTGHLDAVVLYPTNLCKC